MTRARLPNGESQLLGAPAVTSPISLASSAVDLWRIPDLAYHAQTMELLDEHYNGNGLAHTRHLL